MLFRSLDNLYFRKFYVVYIFLFSSTWIASYCITISYNYRLVFLFPIFIAMAGMQNKVLTASLSQSVVSTAAFILMIYIMFFPFLTYFFSVHSYALNMLDLVTVEILGIPIIVGLLSSLLFDMASTKIRDTASLQ